MKRRISEIYIFILFIGVLLTSCRTLPTPDMHPEEPSLKVITYNVNWGARNPQRMIGFLQASGTDVIFLQETHPGWESALKAALGRTYPYSFFEHQPGAGGIAFLSKYKLSKVRILEPGAGWFPALAAEAETPLGPIGLLNVHLRPSLSDKGSVSVSALYTGGSVRLEEIQGFFKAVDPEGTFLIAGDFNEDENGAAVEWLREQGFEDALSIYDSYTKTWRWRTSVGIELKGRYDHILFSKPLHCTGVEVVPVDASDHLPLLGVFIQNREIPAL